MNKPIFSIIIPVYNEEAYIGKCLNSIFASTLSNEKYEVIVVDNGSTDRSTEIISKYRNVKLLREPDCNVGRVRNIGARSALGGYLIFIDSDCTIPPTWLKNKLNLIESNPNTVYGGGILLPPTPTWLERFWTLQSSAYSQLPRKLIGASILIPRKRFLKIGGFDENVSSGEDTELHQRLIEYGTEIVLTNDLDVIHLGNAKTIPKFINRQIWHSENYIKDLKNSIKDPVFLIISAWLIFFISFLITIFLGYPPFIAKLSLIGCLLAPALLTTKRIYRAHDYKLKINQLPLVYFVDCIYIFGRAAGLLRSILIAKNCKIK